jgi:hypothetical protein
MHIFTANISTFHSRYLRVPWVLLIYHFRNIRWWKISYGLKSMHIFNMSKIRHSHRECDMRGWCGTKDRTNRAKVGLIGPTSLASRPGVGAIMNSALAMCQWRSVHGISDAQSQWRPSWEAGRPHARLASQELASNHLKSMVELTHSTYKYPSYPLRWKSVKKVRFSFL